MTAIDADHRPTAARPSAVTAADIARAGATRRARDSRVKIWVGRDLHRCSSSLPVALASVLPLPDPTPRTSPRAGCRR